MSEPSMAHTRKNFIFIYFLLLWISFVMSQPTPLSTDPSFYYNLCAPSKCGNKTLLYPFAFQTPCQDRHVESTCKDDEHLLIRNPASTDGAYRVVSTNFTDSMSLSILVASNNLFSCGSHLSTTTFDNYNVAFSIPINYTSGTHYNCTSPIPHGTIEGLQNASCIGCKGQDPSNICYYAPRLVNSGPPNCEVFSMFLPGDPSSINASAVSDIRALLQEGFPLIFNKPLDCLGCESSGGRCGANPTTHGSQICFCSSSVHNNNCTDGMPIDISKWVKNVGGGEGSGHSKAIVAATSASAAVLLLLVIVALVTMFVRRRNKDIDFDKDTISEISPTRYSYSQLKKFTNNFSTYLGEGGFGSVYKGTIQTKGKEVTVAVKLLKKTTEIEKQFMNEIGTIGSVHHHNLVSIQGYCVDRDAHALVYEFMDNGSLDNYIYTNKKGNDRRLSYKQVFSIALETARGILYLHQGCRVKILHLDIKPSNVLVDSNFSAKVADFGLARMIDKGCSHLSLTGAQGTPGYAAPEMWLKHFGPVTEKSDVYSYGMLLLEMVGRRKLFDSELADSSGAYFPEWLYSKIVRDESISFLKSVGGNQDLGDEEIGREEDEEVVRRRCLVGLWCIQKIPSNRPSIDRVVQMLEGHVEFGVPPNPFQQNTTLSRESSNDQDPLLLQQSR